MGPSASVRSGVCVSDRARVPSGVPERRRVPAPVRGCDRGPAQSAHPVWMDPLLDAGQPVQEPLGSQPAVPGVPVSQDARGGGHTAPSAHTLNMCVSVRIPPGSACTFHCAVSTRRGLQRAPRPRRSVPSPRSSSSIRRRRSWRRLRSSVRGTSCSC